MKPCVSNQKAAALTLVEVLVVAAIIFSFLATILFLEDREDEIGSQKARRVSCVNNLKQIGLAYRLWGNDNNDKISSLISVTNDGVAGLAAPGNAAAYFQSVSEQVSNQMSTPRLLICPADKNTFVATNFPAGLNNQNISYFFGLNADTNHPQAFLAGDDNFEIDGVPVKSGLLEVSTNSLIGWTGARHKFVGNIGLSDGSVLQATISGLTNLLSQTGLATNRLAIP